MRSHNLEWFKYQYESQKLAGWPAEILYLSDSFHNKEMTDLFCFLNENPQINSLYFKPSCKIGDAEAIVLADFLRHNQSIQKIYANNNCIEDAGVIALANALHDSKTLISLSLEGNYFSDQGIAALGEMLKQNQTLGSLLILYNGVSDEGMQSLAEGLIENKKLSKLSLSYFIYYDPLNEDREGWINFINALEKNKFLCELNLDLDFAFGKVSRLLEFFTMLPSNQGLTHLYLKCSGLNLNHELRESVSFALKHNQRIRALNHDISNYPVQTLDINTVSALLLANNLLYDAKIKNDAKYVSGAITFFQGVNQANSPLFQFPIELMLKIFYSVAKSMEIDRTDESIFNFCSLVYLNIKINTNTAREWNNSFNGKKIFKVWETLPPQIELAEENNSTEISDEQKPSRHFFGKCAIL